MSGKLDSLEPLLQSSATDHCGRLQCHCTYVPISPEIDPTRDLQTTTEQFVEFYYKQFDANRSTLAPLYVCLRSVYIR